MFLVVFKQDSQQTEHLITEGSEKREHFDCLSTTLMYSLRFVFLH